MATVNAEFFGLLLGALRKAFGDRLVSQQAFNDLVGHACWVEQTYVNLAPDPNAGRPEEDADVCPECGQEVGP